MPSIDMSRPQPVAESAVASASKLGPGLLTALVVGSMVGSGVFSLPQNMAAGAGANAILIGWLITGVGMLALAFVFQGLAVRKPELDTGPYAYARAGFGEFVGFNSAWGYWLSAWIGNVSYLVILFSALAYFIPVFGDGNTWQAILGDSVAWRLGFALLADQPQQTYGVDIDNGAIVACGVVRSSLYRAHGVSNTMASQCNASSPASSQWPAQWQGSIAQFRPNVVAVLAGR